MPERFGVIALEPLRRPQLSRDRFGDLFADTAALSEDQIGRPLRLTAIGLIAPIGLTRP